MSAQLKNDISEYPVAEFSSIINGRELFLADHVIQGQKILPGMAYLEVSRAAVENSISIAKEELIVLRDSVFINALLVDKEYELTVKVFPGGKNEYGVEISTEKGVHFQTKVFVEKRSTQKPLDITALEDKCRKLGPTKSEFYKYFKERAVELGPSHQGVHSIRLGEDCALTRLSIKGASKRGMGMDPGMLDSVIQGGVALSLDTESNVVPFAVLETHVFAPLDDEMVVYLERSGNGLDYYAANLDGEIIVIVKGFLTREINLDASNEKLSYYKPRWTILENKPYDNDAHVTTVESQGDYNSLFISVLEAAQVLIDEGVDESFLEVKLSENERDYLGVSAALKTITQEYSKINTCLKLGGAYYDLHFDEFKDNLSADFNWPNDGTILMTGGTGGIGRLLAEDIANNTENTVLVLTGRSPIDDEKKAFLQKLEQAGTKAIYRQCDVTQIDQVKIIAKEYSDLVGVIHGAGTLHDNLIPNKTIPEVEQVLAPKVTGLINLDEATKNSELDFFITLSSIAGAIGNVGQIDYAAANGFMDSFIAERVEKVKDKNRKGKSVSINWPLWDADGMQIDDATKENLLKVYKIEPLPADQGINALKQILSGDHQQLVVTYGNPRAIRPLFASKKVNATPDSVKPDQDELSKLTRSIMKAVRHQAAEHLKLKPSQIDEDADWQNFGFDSILLSSFINRVNGAFGLGLMPTVLFEATNLLLFSDFLAENHSQEMLKVLDTESKNTVKKPKQESKQKALPKAELEESTQADNLGAFAHSLKKSYLSKTTYREKDMAIVGVSCEIAGAKTQDDFWKILEEERDMVSEIPNDRWDWTDYPGVSKWGSFISDVDKFDSLFFGVSPAEAMYMNPEQRLMMQYVWKCLEDAGCAGQDIRGTNTGLFVGCGPSGYSSHLSGMPIEAYSATGTVSSVGPNRISYIMDWHGPSNPIDTACSSALVALHRAVEGIRAGHCDQAIAGGVNLLLAPDGYISFSKSGMLAEDGRCKTFSNDANGYVRGEGIGMVLVKRLSAAIRDGNTIYAVVKGTAENHGGRTNSLTAPNPRSQASVIKKAFEDANVDFSRVSYIECHGTGTSLGDPVEIRGLKTVSDELIDEYDSDQKCLLGSIKSNIGHLEYGAGIVGLVKVILQMKHRKIAKSLHCDELNSYIDLQGTPFKIAQQSEDWSVPEGQTRVAGVSSFGFGGVNAHVVLEEYKESVSPDDNSVHNEEGSRQLVIFSAKSDSSLESVLSDFPDFLKAMPVEHDTLSRVAYTLQIGRSEMEERVAFIVDSIDDLIEQIEKFLDSSSESGGRYDVYRGSAASSSSPSIDLSDTEAGRTYLKELFHTNELEKIAELWIGGTKIDWSASQEH